MISVCAPFFFYFRSGKTLQNEYSCRELEDESRKKSKLASTKFGEDGQKKPKEGMETSDHRRSLFVPSLLRVQTTPGGDRRRIAQSLGSLSGTGRHLRSF